MKTVGIADLKARLSSHLQAVRKGHPLTILDRGAPVARIVPLAAEGDLPVRKPVRALRSVRLPVRGRKGMDSLAVLLEEREQDR